ncbi:MAG: hypothetical protein IKC09_08405, partial [Oscillospiraceae bacterium]|nr:hypothetical protein [Oscillospiraceae bacterium]
RWLLISILHRLNNPLIVQGVNLVRFCVIQFTRYSCRRTRGDLHILAQVIRFVNTFFQVFSTFFEASLSEFFVFVARKQLV